MASGTRFKQLPVKRFQALCENSRAQLRASAADAPLYELPDSVHILIAVIGVPAALALVERYRGVRLFVPVHKRQITPDHPLARCIGVEAARKLVQEYSGYELSVPRCLAAMRAVRDREIRRLHHEDGWTAARCAQWATLTERQVYTILAAPGEQDDRQSVLF